MTHMRSKSVACHKCGGTSCVVANLDSGKITQVRITPKCYWPAKCPELFARGVFDRPFGSRIIRPTPGAEL